MPAPSGSVGYRTRHRSDAVTSIALDSSNHKARAEAAAPSPRLTGRRGMFPFSEGQHFPLRYFRPAELEDQRISEGVVRSATVGLRRALLRPQKLNRDEFPPSNVQDVVA